MNQFFQSCYTTKWWVPTNEKTINESSRHYAGCEPGVGDCACVMCRCHTLDSSYRVGFVQQFYWSMLQF